MKFNCKKAGFLLIFLISGYMSFKAQTAQAINCDGVNDYIDPGQLITSFSNNFTMEAWVRPTATIQVVTESTSAITGVSNQKYLLWPTWRNDVPNNSGGIGISVGTNGVGVYEHGPNLITPLLFWSGSLSTWTHIAVVIQAKQPILYINGVQVHAGLTSPRLTIYPSLGKGNNYYAHVGGIGGGSYGYYKGDVDEFRLWSVARTSTQVYENYNKDINYHRPDLYAIYKFNQGIGGGSNSAVNTATDESGSNRTGNLTNFTLSGNSSNWVGSTRAPLVPGPNYYHWEPRNILDASAPGYYSRSFKYGLGCVYYANYSDLITCAWLDGQNNWNYTNITGINTVYYNSPLTLGDYKLFYISSDQRVRNLLYNGSVFSSPELNSSALPARGDGLVFGNNSTVFYASTSNTICSYHWNGTTWAFTNHNIYVRPNTSIVFGDSKLFFTDGQSKVHCLANNGSSWYDTGVLNSSAPMARGDAMVCGAAGEFFYSDYDGNAVRLYSSGSSWLYEAIPLSNKIMYFSNMEYDAGRVFFNDNASRLTVLLKDACQWLQKPLINVAINNQSPFSFGNGCLFAWYNSRLSVYQPTNPSDFPYAYLKGKTFYQNGTAFYPNVMNYLVDVVTDGTNYFIQPYSQYYPAPTMQPNASAGLAALNAQFAQISSLGFNAIRVLGFAAWHKTTDASDMMPYAQTFNPALNPTLVEKRLDASYNSTHFSLIKQMLDAAAANGLKVILCAGQGELVSQYRYQNYASYLSALGADPGIRDHPALLAYDLFNEPDGVNPVTYPELLDKGYICLVSDAFYQSVRNSDPSHLITINTFGPGSLQTWDPGILSCDFYSFHFYTHEPTYYNDVAIATYWNKIALKDRPWIIGETSFSAEEKYVGQDDCLSEPYGVHGEGTEAQQKAYVINTQNWVRGAGGSGYSWWQYHDVYWPGVEHWQGVISDCNRLKASAAEFNKNFLDPLQFPCSSMTQPTGYYGATSGTYKVTGKILDMSGVPISGAWLKAWSNQVEQTYTDQDGNFTLWTSVKAGNVAFTALGKEIKSWLYTDPNWYTASSGTEWALGTFTLDNAACGIPEGLGRQQEPQADKSPNSDLFVFPNPAQSQVNIRFSVSEGQEHVKLTISNIIGETVRSIEVNTENKKTYETSVNITDLSAGVYVITLIGSENKMIAKKLIIQ